jgi:hypothetical protein
MLYRLEKWGSSFKIFEGTQYQLQAVAEAGRLASSKEIFLSFILCKIFKILIF